jgi:hypothetical protein
MLSGIRLVHQLTFAKYELDGVDVVRPIHTRKYAPPARGSTESAAQLVSDNFAAAFGRSGTSGIFQAQPAERTNAVNEKRYQAKKKEARNRLAGVRSRIQEAQGVILARKGNKSFNLDLWLEKSVR